MIDGAFVINPTVHAYNLDDSNVRPNQYGMGFRDMLVDLHQTWNPEEFRMPVEAYRTDWSMETLARTLFLETDVDVAGNMNLRLDSWFFDGLCSREKNVEAHTRWPDRFLTYVGVDPTSGVDVCIRDLEEQMIELPNSIGLKMYPDQVDPLRSWRMDDPAVAYPLFERAQELGIKTIAVHKAIPNGPVPIDPYKVEDVDGAAIHFPDLSFEIIHSGLAFIDETALAIARFPNVYANLEITSALLLKAPGRFEAVLAELIFWGGAEKIIHSDGAMSFHSQPILERLWNLEFSEETMNRVGVEQLTRADKELIVGGNYARVIDFDVEASKSQIATDEFAQERAKTGIQAPYSNWRAQHSGLLERGATHV